MLYEEKKNQINNHAKFDQDITNVEDTSTDDDKKNVNEQFSNLAVVVSNVTAKWTDKQTDNSLENINLTIRSGQLVAIIGPVGVGKVYKYKNNLLDLHKSSNTLTYLY